MRTNYVAHIGDHVDKIDVDAIVREITKNRELHKAVIREVLREERVRELNNLRVFRENINDKRNLEMLFESRK